MPFPFSAIVGQDEMKQALLIAAADPSIGGVLVFGTDVGYRKDSDTGGEFEALTRCGLSGRDILRMLGPAPASKFPEAGNRGTIEIGQAADLTVLGGDPIADPRGFADVRVTIRNGQVIWRRPQ